MNTSSLKGLTNLLKENVVTSHTAVKNVKKVYFMGLPKHNWVCKSHADAGNFLNVESVCSLKNISHPHYAFFRLQRIQRLNCNQPCYKFTCKPDCREEKADCP